MDNCNRSRPHKSRSPHPERKPAERHDNSDRGHARRRSSDYGREARTTSVRRSCSPGRSRHEDHRDYRRISEEDAGRARDDQYEMRYSERSRPPSHDEKHRSRRERDSRSPSHHRHYGHHHRRHHRHRRASSTSHREPAPTLPFNARRLSRSADYVAFRPLFARYLDLQKQIDITELDEREVRGRWKSFINKWNSAQLAEGWYQPEVFQSAMLDYDMTELEDDRTTRGERRSTSDDHYAREDSNDIHAIIHQDREGTSTYHERGEAAEEEDDDYGPTLPAQDNLDNAHSAANPQPLTKHGPGIPSVSDLTLRREREILEREDAFQMLRQERKADRTLQKERLEELAPPRADPGTAARRLEKRHEVRDANARFANAKSSNDMPDFADADLIGAEGGGIEEYKRLKKEAERKKTEREVRREEILRAKKEEREGRIREYKQREAQTVDMLREIAKSRFG